MDSNKPNWHLFLLCKYGDPAWHERGNEKKEIELDKKRNIAKSIQ